MHSATARYWGVSVQWLKTKSFNEKHWQMQSTNALLLEIQRDQQPHLFSHHCFVQKSEVTGTIFSNLQYFQAISFCLSFWNKVLNITLPLSNKWNIFMKEDSKGHTLILSFHPCKHKTGICLPFIKD